MTNFIIYRRISGGQNQIKSGLGLEGQLTEINCFLASCGDYKVVDEFVEVKSGKDHKNRPILQKAIEKAIRTKSVILVSRLCRLSRDLEFTASLLKNSKVSFKVASIPSADNLTLSIHAVMLQRERELTGIRTKIALREVRKTGKLLGRTGSENIKQANEKRISAANKFATKAKLVIQPFRDQGKTYQQIAEILQGLNFKTPQGKDFSKAQVRRYALGVC